MEFYQEFKPTIWHRMGFREAAAPRSTEREDAEFVVTETTVALGFLDRLRVLVCGTLRVQTRTYTSAPVDVLETTSAVGVTPRSWRAR